MPNLRNPSLWPGRLPLVPMLVYKAFGIATAIFVRAGFWINVIQPSMVQHVQLVTFLELFLCKVGVNLPVRVGNKWMQFDNSNAGTLLGRSLGAQIQVLEWLVRGVFDNHLGCALGVFQIAKQNLLFFSLLKLFLSLGPIASYSVVQRPWFRHL